MAVEIRDTETIVDKIARSKSALYSQGAVIFFDGYDFDGHDRVIILERLDNLEQQVFPCTVISYDWDTLDSERRAATVEAENLALRDSIDKWAQMGPNINHRKKRGCY